LSDECVASQRTAASYLLPISLAPTTGPLYIGSVGWFFHLLGGGGGARVIGRANAAHAH